MGILKFVMLSKSVPTTINQIQRWLASGGEVYKMVVEKLIRKNKFVEFLKILGEILPTRKDIYRWGYGLAPEKEEKESYTHG